MSWAKKRTAIDYAMAAQPNQIILQGDDKKKQAFLGACKCTFHNNFKRSL
jgi:hypothetical protein